ncbi:MAG: GPW/gp25 family protein [Pilosibacter sp.]
MEEREKRAFLGTGFHFPLEIDETTGRFRMSSEEENIRESIKLILMTGKGERVMRPEFGCGLKQYTYETMDYGTMVQMEREIKTALERWEPRIEMWKLLFRRGSTERADDPDRVPGQGNQQPV